MFGAGFVFFGSDSLARSTRRADRIAELIESPITLVLILVVARWAVRRLPASATRFQYVTVGLVALALPPTCEFVLWLGGLRIGESLANQDPIGDMAYLALLAVMPLALARRQRVVSAGTFATSNKAR